MIQMSFLIAKKKMPSFLMLDDWHVGWLMDDGRERIWMTWGAFKSLDSAKKSVQEQRATKEIKQVFFTEDRLEKEIAKDQTFTDISEEFH